MRKLVLISLLLVLVAACTAEQREVLQTMVAAAPTLSSQAVATATPEISAIELPTAAPTMGGPMGTLTAIADLMAPPELDDTPYTIALRGNPHFIEFHAFW